jgi:hypothetical protein
MKKFAILASVITLSVASANCGNNADRNVLSPSSLSNTEAASSNGKGGGKNSGGGTTTGGSGSLSIVMVSDANGDGHPNWGDSIRFNVTTSATSEPNVSVTCSQNGVVVYGATTGYYASYPWPWTQTMTLSSNSWQAGAASCTAKLYYFSGTSTINLSSMTFTAGA